MRLLAFRKRLNDTKKKGEFMKTFYINGTILTMEENNLYAEAVCTENGIIQAVGTKEELLKLRSEGDRIIDLEGMPDQMMIDSASLFFTFIKNKILS